MSDDFNVNEKLRKILNDNFSGGTDILLNLISYFSEKPEELKNIELLNFLAARLSPFQSIKNFFLRSEKYSFSEESEILNFLTNEKDNLFKEINTLFEKSLPFFEGKNNFATISNSFFLRNFILLLYDANKEITVSVSESRPQFEGRILAETLAANNIKVNLFTEAQTPKFVEDSDAVLIGADKILSDGSVVNKTGSRNLAVAAQYFHKPFYVLASKNKFSDSNDFDEGVHKASEIYNNNNFEMISVTNQYFERIEPSLVTAILNI
ncbi:MAG: hypothetical protein GXO87_09325 [Chlorobi bacterium]|nr:hypothetical protein [Chlorobiota bacterium]